MSHKAATLTVAGKCGQAKTKGVQVVEGVGLVATTERVAAVFANFMSCFLKLICIFTSQSMGLM